MYDLKTEPSELGTELKKIAQQFPGAIDEIFAAIVFEPETVNRPLRKIDSLVKNVFHICEVARNALEPYEVAVLLAKRKLEEKKKLRDHLKAAVEDARSLISPK